MSDIKTCLEMAIIGISLSYLRPSIYLNVKNRIAYLKSIPTGCFEFRLEGTVPHSKGQYISAYHGHIRVVNEEGVNTGKDFIKIFNRDEIRRIKRDRIPDYRWVQ